MSLVCVFLGEASILEFGSDLDVTFARKSRSMLL